MGFDALEGVRDVATFTQDGGTYLIAASDVDNAVQLIDVSNPDGTAGGAPVAAADAFVGAPASVTMLNGALRRMSWFRDCRH